MMMVRNIILIVFSFFGLFANGQQKLKDSLLRTANDHTRDTAGVSAFLQLADIQTDPDSVIHYVSKAQTISDKLEYKKGKADCFLILSKIGKLSVIYGQSIQYALNALNIYTDIDYKRGMATANGRLQAIYRASGQYKKSLDHAFEAKKIAETNNTVEEYMFPGHASLPLILAEIGQTYVLMDSLDLAEYFTQSAIQKKELFNNAEWNFPIYLLATIQNMKGSYVPALENYRRALSLAVKNEVYQDTLQIFSGMSTLFRNMKITDSAIHYAQMVVNSQNPELETKNRLEAIANLADLYKMKKNKDSALKYVELTYSLRDSIYSNEKDREIQNIIFNETLKQQELVSNQLIYKNKVQLYTLVSGIVVLILVAGILWINNRNKQKAKSRIEKAYAELKATQQQLIQSEKMASLGELTAGIAHEIQNPLNFVNNFSEVNKELIEELRGERRKVEGLRDEETEDDILNSIEQNLQKVLQHGQRADAIVKGMLQHSRSSTGHKEPVDINTLADEYLRLALHGIRAKDQSFNTEIQTDFDPNVGKINVISQDIGRALINLYSNAFYAVLEKKKLVSDSYQPEVKISTRNNGKLAEITVWDNGNGIPESIRDKIFQPFFTTKPPGQGTGLGLSMAYDIVKAHGGELKVETKEGEGVAFIIQLPLYNS